MTQYYPVEFRSGLFARDLYGYFLRFLRFTQSFDYAAAAFPLVAVGLGVLLSASSIALEEMSFHVYPRARDTARLFLMSVLENFGYRQLNSVWRIIGMFGWILRRPARWGEMPRGAGNLGK